MDCMALEGPSNNRGIVRLPLVDLDNPLIFGEYPKEIIAKQQINHLTARAWFMDSKQLEEKVLKMSLQNGVPSEYTHIILLQADNWKKQGSEWKIHEVFKKTNKKLIDTNGQNIICPHSFHLGFGDLTATVDNIHLEFRDGSLQVPASGILAKAVSNCRSRFQNCWCGMCCIQTCSHVNDQCAIVLTQLCTALSCFGCLSCCADLCFN
ncbi:hypothetical protein GIB67_009036 [Kingdonia uniflora]|uniref:Uncharacterized protein n=1 Tax=Kingdonia uniflora TaxID=39325 RepID=A0A7J7LW47_9MAGN|nr:hypothetical protein GIB67_009036 [Kingdonia uniflora]